MLLIAATPAVAEFTPYDYHIMYTANGNYVVYDFPDVMLYIPIEWEDAITVEQTDSGVVFFQTASYDKFLEDDLPKGGFLFKLCASEDESFRELPEYEYIGFSENAGKSVSARSRNRGFSNWKFENRAVALLSEYAFGLPGVCVR